jgi:hypothetical protein
VVFLSRVGVERRDNFMIKMNPFLKIEAWYQAEEAVKVCVCVCVRERERESVCV